MARFDPQNYVDVQERINRFWAEHPNGRIVTEMMSSPDEFERVVFMASVFKGQGSMGPDVTGWAAEVAGSGGANQTSWHENCETSAIGRALANMGYATTREDRPSRQEMSKVERAQPAPRTVVNGQPTAPLPGMSGVPERRADPRTGELEDVAPKLANAGQVAAIERLWRDLGRDEADLGTFLFGLFAQESAAALTGEQAGECIVALGKERTAMQPVRG